MENEVQANLKVFAEEAIQLVSESWQGLAFNMEE